MSNVPASGRPSHDIVREGIWVGRCENHIFEKAVFSFDDHGPASEWTVACLQGGKEEPRSFHISCRRTTRTLSTLP